MRKRSNEKESKDELKHKQLPINFLICIFDKCSFEEEKTVAEKAPIDGIKISDLNSSNKTKKKFFILSRLEKFINLVI